MKKCVNDSFKATLQGRYQCNVIIRYNDSSHSLVVFPLLDVCRYQPIPHSVPIPHSNKHRLRIFSYSDCWHSLRDVWRDQPISHSGCWLSLCKTYGDSSISHSLIFALLHCTGTCWQKSHNTFFFYRISFR